MARFQLISPELLCTNIFIANVSITYTIFLMFELVGKVSIAVGIKKKNIKMLKIIEKEKQQE